MGSCGVVIRSPIFDDFPGAVQADKDIVVQALIPEFAVKAFDIGILSRFARLNEPQLDVVLVSPQVKRVQRQ